MAVDGVRPEDQRIELGLLLGAILSRWLRIILVTVILLAITLVILLFLPKQYESTAALLVEQRANAAAVAPAEAQSIPPEAMMSSQIELIRSRDTLLSVIDSENLRSEAELSGAGFSPVGFVLRLFGRTPEPRSIDETVLDNLNERLSVARQRDSAVITITVRSEDPELAARIANALAAAHVRRRADLSLADTAEASEWLEEEIKRLRVAVTEAEAAVANHRVENDLFTGGEGGGLLLDQQITAVSAQITASQERKNAALSRANLIRDLVTSGRPLDGVQAVRDSAVIQQLSQTRANLQSELAQRSSTLLPNHPTIKALVAQVAEIDQQITREARRVADALEAEAEIEADLEQSLRDDLARAKLAVSTATREGVTLEGLQREARAQRELLEAYLARYTDAASRIGQGSALPDVRQITVAAPVAEPAWPKTPLVLGAVAFVALALQIGSILFGELMSGRATIERAPPYRETEVLIDDDAEDDDVEPVDASTLQPLGEDDDQSPTAAMTAEVPPTAGASRAEPAQAPAPAARATPPEPARLEIAPPAPVQPRRPEPLAAEPADAAAVAPRSTVYANELANLSADIAIGRVRVVLLAGLGNEPECERVADTLVEDALRRGLSVVKIDAGSGRTSPMPGLTDLAAGSASFGDVVHRVREGLAEVPWGQEAVLERRSMRPLTLIEALTDIYEVVVVLTGRIGLSSSLSVFHGIGGRLVLVGEDQPDRAAIEAAIDDAAGFGFEVGQVVSSVAARPAVA